MKQKTIIIIGAGIAGLAAGCYAQMNGYRTQIFEMHDKPGGLCTSWKRKGYTIDGCIHCMNASGPSSPLHPVMKELGIVQGRRFFNYGELLSFEGKGNKVFTVYTDIDHLEQHMLELAPQDKEIIKEFIGALRVSASLTIPLVRDPELFGPVNGLKTLVKMMPFYRMLKQWGRISIGEFAERFSDPFLREAFAFIFRFPDLSMMTILFSLGWMSTKASGFPEGGSLELSKAVERRYLDLGGVIHYRSTVSKIQIQNDRAIGVILADGTKHNSDIVISAADGHATIFDMLDARYIDNKIKGYYDKIPIYPPQIMVALGVNRTFEHTKHLLIFPLKEPVFIGEHEEKYFIVQIYNFDASLAPSGKTVLSVKFDTDYEYWSRLKETPERYQLEKKKIADQVIAILEQRFPGLAGQVEMYDVATPMTWNRFTGNWQGGIEGWLSTKETFGMLMSKTLPGLSDFYLCGQWVAPGGSIAQVAMVARDLVHIICKRDKKRFITQEPPSLNVSVNR